MQVRFSLTTTRWQPNQRLLLTCGIVYKLIKAHTGIIIQSKYICAFFARSNESYWQMRVIVKNINPQPASQNLMYNVKYMQLMFSWKPLNHAAGTVPYKVKWQKKYRLKQILLTVIVKHFKTPFCFTLPNPLMYSIIWMCSLFYSTTCVVLLFNLCLLIRHVIPMFISEYPLFLPFALVACSYKDLYTVALYWEHKCLISFRLPFSPFKGTRHSYLTQPKAQVSGTDYAMGMSLFLSRIIHGT